MYKLLFTFFVLTGLSAQNSIRPDLWLKTPRDSSTTHLNFINPLQVENTDSIYTYKSKGSNLFYVFKPNEQRNISVLNLFTNAKSYKIDQKKIDKYNLETKYPKIVNFYKSQTSSNNKTIINLYDSINSTDNVYEILYFKKNLSDLYKSKINTYLALKYGLDYKGLYVNKDNDTLFKDRKFNFHKISIFEDKLFNYVNNQTQFSIDSLYMIKLNYKNVSNFSKSNYILLSDNGKNFEFKIKKSDNNNTYYSNRIWKLENNNLTNSEIDFIFNNKNSLNDSLKTYLITSLEPSVLNFYRDSQILDNLNDSIYRINVDDKLYFKFIKGHEKIFDYSFTYDCYTKKFDVQLFSNSLGENYKLFNSNSLITTNTITSNSTNISNLLAGNYVLKIGSSTYNISLQPIENVEFLIQNEYVINSSYDMVEVNPNVFSNLYAEYYWYREGNLISEEPYLITNIPGNYFLKIKNSTCEFEREFKIVENFKNNWNVYPNPVSINQSFTIDYHLINKENVTVTIFDISGKLIKTFNKNNSFNDNFNFSLNSSGVYLIKFQSQSVNSTHKLIVK